MLARRLLVCLDVQDARVVKGTRFESLRDVGDPVELAERYEAAGADEMVFLDISASADERTTLLEMVNRTAERLFIPLTVGGGIRSVDDVSRALQAGADKVSINSAAVARPELITECAERYGAQCVVASIDAKRDGDGWLVRTRGGRSGTALDAVEWARECAERGAGEILLTSIDRDGVRGGYDLELTRAVSRAVKVPVVASGGAGSAEHIVDAFRLGEADAALVAGILHDGVTTVAELKRAMQDDGIPVRAVTSAEANMGPRFRGDDEGGLLIPAKAG
ncbi:MAG TPA: imidazole glycerol phosphate synthase subunit HisF, partial [Gemmatimonadaceae bacterium]|nr:imidazole glycerol phosphate synthase subunit HisF [Gemmatimonadaceae bacterium]